MKEIKSLIIFLLFLVSVSGFAQEVKLKKGIVYIDGKECMKYDNDGKITTYTDMEGNEIMFIQYNGTAGRDMYVKVGFTKSKESFTTKYVYTKTGLVEKLVKSKAISDCGLVAEKVTDFVFKNDEKIDN